MNVSNFPQLPLCLPCSLFPGLKPFLVTVPFVCGFFCFPEIKQVPYNLDSHGPLDPLDSQLELGSQKPSAVWKHKARLISICSEQRSRSEKMVVDFIAFCTNTTPYTDHLFLWAACSWLTQTTDITSTFCQHFLLSDKKRGYTGVTF